MAIQRIALFILHFLRTRRFARQFFVDEMPRVFFYPLLSSFLSAFSVHLQTELLSLDKQKRKKNVFLVFFLSISRVLDTEIVTLRIILSL